MAAVVGLTLIKKFSYRGDPLEEFSNQYWLSGGIPANGAAWRTLTDALIAEERKVYQSDVAIVRAYGYDDNTEGASAVWSLDLTVSPEAPVIGSLSGVAALPAHPGDAAAWVRWKTSRLNSKGKPIYLRKYFHGVHAAASTGGDTIAAVQATAYNNFGLFMASGNLVGVRHIRSQSNDETTGAVGVSPFVTTRTLKRRGKRPNS